MSRLPRGYLQLEYIQSTGTQYVDTRFLPNQNTRVVIDFKSTFSTANSPKGLLGCRNSSDIGLFAFLYSNRIDPNYNGVGKSVTVDSLQRHVYDFNKNSFSVDGAAVSFDAGVFSPGYNLLLLSLQNYGAIDARKAEGYLYASQIYDNGTLVRDFVPCVSPSGAVGLFDLVGREFYGNAGTGTFTAGPVVLPALPRGYKRLEYIQSSGTQYVDTDFLPNQDTRVVIDACLTEYVSSYLYGAQVASGSYYYIGGYTGSALLEAWFRTIKSISIDTAVKRRVIDHNKNVLTTDDGYSLAFSAATFQSSNTMFLFGANNGSLLAPTKARVYSCQIYDNGVPVRCFVPCINPSGEVGLYDAIFHKFYVNAGTGSFTAGAEMEAEVYEEPEIIFLEYIESTGGQYADTGFVPNQDTRVVAEFETQSSNGDWRCVFGARTTGNNKQSLGFYLSNADVFSGFYGDNKQFSFSGIGVAGVHTVDWNKNTITLDGTAQTVTAQTYNSTVSLYICSVHTPVVADTHYLQGKIYSCQIYDDGAFVRDYLPARTSDGDVGLYDQVDGLFYPNAGSGVFLAGPEVEQTPSAPTGFAAGVEGDKVTLRWDAKDEVLGYRVYRDGLLLADTTATEIEDTITPFVRTTYAVSAYNDLGEGKAATLVLYVVPEIPVLYLVTDRTAADVAAGNAKGSYTATDLARVNTAMDYVRRLLTSMGYACPITTDADWTDEEWGTPATMNLYLQNLATIRNALAAAEATPAVPESMSSSESGKSDGLTYTKANNIEQILVDVYETILLIKQQAVPCGAAECGGAYL